MALHFTAHLQTRAVIGTKDLLARRDLRPTIELNSVLQGILHDHLRVSRAQLGSVFPGSEGAGPFKGLIR